jgi:hypothetical protein
MPASTESPEQRSGKLPTGLLWAGVGVAPLAALALLLGSESAATGLTLLAVILIGLSIALRPADSVKVELADTIYDEIDVVREDVRNDIATAARATHRAFAERSQYLQETVEQLRGQLEALRGELARSEALRAASAPHAPSPDGAPSRPGTVSGSVPAGVVRHTETVQVTTRGSTTTTTWVDSVGSATPPSHAGRGGRRRAEEREQNPAPAPAEHSAYEESWTEQQLRKRLAEAASADIREPRSTGEPGRPVQRESLLSHEDISRSDRWGGRGEAVAPAETGPADDRWSGLRRGDRWAALRSDDRGSELRMGERRASLHTDDSGAEVRIEDRWAAIRRDEPRAGRRHDAAAWETDRWSEPRDRGEDRDGGWEGGNWESPHTRRPRALSATSDEPSASDWLNRWSPAEPEPRRHRYAEDY